MWIIIFNIYNILILLKLITSNKYLNTLYINYFNWSNIRNKESDCDRIVNDQSAMSHLF